jgi:zinc transporter 1/2/3
MDCHLHIYTISTTLQSAYSLSVLIKFISKTMLRLALTLAACFTAVLAQTTYTGCHNLTSGDQVLLYCFGPNGQETARETYAAAALTTPAPNTASATAPPSAGQTTAVTSCHGHGSDIFCFNGAGAEVLVKATPTGAIPPAYTGCHAHGSSQ